MEDLQFLEEVYQALEYAGMGVAVTSAAIVAYDKLFSQDTNDDLEVFRNSLSKYKNQEIDWPAEDNIEAHLESMELTYQITERGTPATEEDLEKAQRHIQRNPADAALNRHRINKALEQDIDVQEYLN